MGMLSVAIVGLNLCLYPSYSRCSLRDDYGTVADYGAADGIQNCNNHHTCAGDEYCDEAANCYHCNFCYLLRDTYDGKACPTKCHENENTHTSKHVPVELISVVAAVFGYPVACPALIVFFSCFFGRCLKDVVKRRQASLKQMFEEHESYWSVEERAAPITTKNPFHRMENCDVFYLEVIKGKKKAVLNRNIQGLLKPRDDFLDYFQW
eukprot:CAMPEP_0170143926 /NCGR_PEP_ID=MMETSP0033_2-20121228/13210_1 /TAXON_ID=195969 /ORGANISM="Dolichomastix tenuilepis, Strain CCMP3274" /LENGTH=207 /DNA_ID=CAMNT_0010380399 /DNA_START=274 /DNA_END=894 /DNA_ORIENTATION=-